MARRSKQPKANPDHPAYRVVFSGWPPMRERLSHILEVGTDPQPGLSSCRNLELCIEALAEGKPVPINAGELNGGVEYAVRELFALRDMSAVS